MAIFPNSNLPAPWRAICPRLIESRADPLKATRIVFFKPVAGNTVSINEGCFVGHRVRVISVSDRSPSVILGLGWQPNSRCAVSRLMDLSVSRIHPSSVSPWKFSILSYVATHTHVYVCTYVHVCVSTASNGNPRAIQWPLVIKLFRLPRLER